MVRSAGTEAGRSDGRNGPAAGEGSTVVGESRAAERPDIVGRPTCGGSSETTERPDPVDGGPTLAGESGSGAVTRPDLVEDTVENSDCNKTDPASTQEGAAAWVVYFGNLIVNRIGFSVAYALLLVIVLVCQLLRLVFEFLWMLVVAVWIDVLPRT